MNIAEKIARGRNGTTTANSSAEFVALFAKCDYDAHQWQQTPDAFVCDVCGERVTKAELLEFCRRRHT